MTSWFILRGSPSDAHIGRKCYEVRHQRLQSLDTVVAGNGYLP